jgi:peptidyl-prolyl cis-trans isomerase D
MAMIDKIRRQRELLVILIGLGMLMFLIPYDAVMAIIGVGPNRSVGEVNGESISLARYQVQLEDRRDFFNSTTPETVAWNDLVEEAMFTSSYEELGIEVTNDEFQEVLYGENISTYVQNAFYPQFGGVTPEARPQMQNWFSSMYDGNIQGQRQFYAYHRAIIDARKREKWNSLLGKSPYATTLETKWDDEYNNAKVNIQVVAKLYEEIPDSLYDVSDKEIEDYYSKHKNEDQYKQLQAEREIKYIEVLVDASNEDSLAYLDELEELRPGWEAAENDSAYCVQHTATKQYFTVDYSPGSLTVDSLVDKSLTNDSLGTIIGPYKESNYYRLVRIINKKKLPDSVQTRSILFGRQNQFTAQDLANADSVFAILQDDPSQFDALMTEFTSDTASLADPIKWVGDKTKNRKARSYMEPVNWADVGDIVRIPTQSGIFIIEVMDQAVSAEDYTIKIAAIDRFIAPSNASNKAAYTDLNKQFLNSKTREAFETLADELEFEIKTASFTRDGQITEVQGSERMVSWANGETEEGKVSHPIKTARGHAIACLTLIKDEGPKPLESVREAIEKAVLNEKKGEDFYARMREGDTLEQIALAIDGEVTNSSGIRLSSNYLPNISQIQTGNENDYEVVGLCFGMSQDELTVYKGVVGVYALSPVGEIAAAPEKEFLVTEQDALINTYRTSYVTPNKVYNAMRDASEIIDKRYEQ